MASVVCAIEQDESVKVWLGRIKNHVAFPVFKRFWKEVIMRDDRFRHMSPTQLAEWQSNARGRQAYVLKSLLQEWLNALDLRIGSKSAYQSYVSSFFLHVHAPLPADPSFHFKSNTPAVQGELTFDSFKQILLNSNKMYRAVFLMQAQMLAGPGDVVYVSNHCWREILEALTKNVGIFKIVLPGRKKERNVKNYFTMLNTKSDWAHAYHEHMKSSGQPIWGCLFRNERGNPLTVQNIEHYFHWRAVEVGTVKHKTPACTSCQGETVRVRKNVGGKPKIAYRCRECGTLNWAGANLSGSRYGVNPHEIRDLMRSRWRASGAETVVAEFMMQHGEQVDPNHYDKLWYTPGYAEKEYRKALPWLNVLSQDPERVDRHEIEAKLSERDHELDELKRKLAVLDDPALLEALRELKKRSQQ